MRADVFLVESGHAVTRSQAQRLIAAGVQWRAGAGLPWKKVAKNGDEIPVGAELELLDMAEAKYISRGGLKLEGALQATGLRVEGLRCLDIGQSTGGFTDCLLQQGAVQVVGVDVGQGQLHERLRSDPRVLCIEGMNARSMTADSLEEACEMVLSERWEAPVAQEERELVNPYRWMSGDGEVTDYDDSDDVEDEEIDGLHEADGEDSDEEQDRSLPRRKREFADVDTSPEFDFLTGDVSFISLTLILPAVVRLLKPHGHLLMLVKPQFELQPGQIGKGGIVRDAEHFSFVQERLQDCCKQLGLSVKAWLASPIEGGDGNREFFIHAQQGDVVQDADQPLPDAPQRQGAKRLPRAVLREMRLRQEVYEDPEEAEQGQPGPARGKRRPV